MAFDPKRLSPLDWAIVGGGGVAFISAFLPWWGIDLGELGRGLGVDTTVSGWSAEFTAWFGVLLLTLAAVYHFLQRAEISTPKLPVGPAVATAGVALLGLVLILIRLVTLPSSPFGDTGARFGIYLAILAGIVETVAAVMQFRTSGEALPWKQANAS